MGAWAAAVVEDFPARTPCLLQGVGQDRELVEGPVVVEGLGELEDGGCPPGRVEVYRAEGVADDVPEESYLFLALSRLCIAPGSGPRFRFAGTTYSTDEIPSYCPLRYSRIPVR
jgi:hypothetical protein